MARIIFITPYMKGGRDSARLAHRTRYFATREGVQLLKDDNAHLPVTKKQQQYIQRLLRSFPEARELPEYENYANTPNRKTAFAFIEQIHEDFIEPMDSRENYLDYVANRPGVKSMGEHGLWNAHGKVPSLENAIAEVAQHTGNVWTPIIPLSRENAERLGYTDLKNWQELINASITDIAKGYKIRPSHLRWYAALHEKEKHLHVHMIIFSTDPKEGFLTSKVSAASSPRWSARSTGTTACTSISRRTNSAACSGRKRKHGWQRSLSRWLPVLCKAISWSCW